MKDVKTSLENKLKSVVHNDDTKDVENQLREKIEALEKVVLDKDSEMVDLKIKVVRK